MGITHHFMNIVGGYSHSQRLVRDVTADNGEKPEPYDMRQIANMSHESKNIQPMMKTLYQRMNDKGKHWIHVYKALNLLLYLLSYGGYEVVEWYDNNTYLVQSLCTYEQVDDQGKDVADGIRKSAKQIIALAGNKPKLDEFRIKAAKILDIENQQDLEARRQEAEVLSNAASTGTSVAISGAAL